MSAPERFFRSLETRNLLSDRCGSLSFGHFPAALIFCPWGESISPCPLALPRCLAINGNMPQSVSCARPLVTLGPPRVRVARGEEVVFIGFLPLSTYALLLSSEDTMPRDCYHHSCFCSPMNRDMIKTAVSTVAMIDNREWIVSFNRGRVKHGAVDDQGFGYPRRLLDFQA